MTGSSQPSAPRVRAARSPARPAPPSRTAFVAGLARSGTSLLARLIDGHPQALVLPCETHLEDWCGAREPAAALLEGTRWGEAARALRDGGAAFLADLQRRLAGPASLEEALAALAGAWWQALGRPARELLVEKTPRHLRRLPVLALRCGPTMRAVAVVRGPRQVLASTRRRWGRQRRHAVLPFARRWALAADLAARYQAERDDVLVVRYEDLVRHTKRTMRRIAGHLRLTWDDVLLVPTRGGRAWRANSSFGPGPEQVHAQALVRWQDELPEHDVVRLERLLAPRMRAWGYEPATCPERRAAPSRAWLEACVAHDLRRMRRAWRRGGAF